MAASLFDYESGLSDLSEKYAQDDATSQYARFISKQRFGRDREDANRSYGRAFPQFTGQYAKRLGSGIKSGVFQEKLSQNVGDYNRTLGRMDEDEAGFDSNFEQNRALKESSYNRALLQLQEQLQRQRVMENPFASYQAVY